MWHCIMEMGFSHFPSTTRKHCQRGKLHKSPRRKWSLAGESVKCVDRVKYVSPDGEMKNCDIDKCDINGKTLREFKSLPNQIQFVFRFSAARKNGFWLRGLRLH